MPYSKSKEYVCSVTIFTGIYLPYRGFEIVTFHNRILWSRTTPHHSTVFRASLLIHSSSKRRKAYKCSSVLLPPPAQGVHGWVRSVDAKRSRRLF